MGNLYPSPPRNQGWENGAFCLLCSFILDLAGMGVRCFILFCPRLQLPQQRMFLLGCPIDFSHGWSLTPPRDPMWMPCINDVWCVTGDIKSFKICFQCLCNLTETRILQLKTKSSQNMAGQLFSPLINRFRRSGMNYDSERLLENDTEIPLGNLSGEARRDRRSQHSASQRSNIDERWIPPRCPSIERKHCDQSDGECTIPQFSEEKNIPLSWGHTCNFFHVIFAVP